MIDGVGMFPQIVRRAGQDFGSDHQGVDAARAVAEKYGLEFLPAEGLGYGDIRPTLRELAAEGASLMIAQLVPAEVLARSTAYLWKHPDTIDQIRAEFNPNPSRITGHHTT